MFTCCLRVCMCVYKCVHIHVCLCLCTYMCTYRRVCMYVHVRTRAQIIEYNNRVYIMHISLYKCVQVPTPVHPCIHSLNHISLPPHFVPNRSAYTSKYIVRSFAFGLIYTTFSPFAFLRGKCVYSWNKLCLQSIIVITAKVLAGDNASRYDLCAQPVVFDSVPKQLKPHTLQKKLSPPEGAPAIVRAFYTAAHIRLAGEKNPLKKRREIRKSRGRGERRKTESPTKI